MYCQVMKICKEITIIFDQRLLPWKAKDWMALPFSSSQLQTCFHAHRGGFTGWRGGRAPPYFYNRLFFFFCSHFEELQTVLFEVELIINNAPLTYVYPNTIEACLTPNHLLFGRQLLYSSNTTSTVVRNLTVLSSTTDKTNRIIFWISGDMNM